MVRRRVFYSAFIFLLLLCFMILGISSFSAVAEANIFEQKLTAKLEVVEYARLEGYTLPIDFEDLDNATDSFGINQAVENLLDYIDSSINAAQIEANLFDQNLMSLPLLNDLTLDDYNDLILLDESYYDFSQITQQYITKYSILTLKIEEIRLIAGEEFLILQEELPIDLDILEEDVVLKVDTIRTFYDYYSLELIELEDAQFLFIEEKVNDLLKEQEDNVQSLEVIELIDALPEAITLTLQEEMEIIRSAYDALSEEAKLKVTNYPEFLIQEARIEDLLVSKQNAEIFEAKLDTISDNITFDDKEYIQSLRMEYNTLSEEAKQFVGSLIKLINAEATLASQDIAKAIADEVVASINLLTDITLDHTEYIETVRIAYNDLSEISKGFVTNYAMLVYAESRVDELVAAKTIAEEFAEIIDTLPDVVLNVDEEDEISIQNAGRYISGVKEDYDALDEDIRFFISNSDVIDLCLDAVDSIKDIYQANIVILWIDSIGNVYYSEDIPLIESARLAYDALSVNAKKLITNYHVLTMLEHEALLYDSSVAAAEAVDSAILSIGAVTYDKKEAIESVRAMYENLSEQSKSNVTKRAILETAEIELSYIINERESAKSVIKSIARLPISITLEDTESVAQAIDEYMLLSNTARNFVTNYSTLLAAEAKIAALIVMEDSITHIIALIDVIPIEITMDNYLEAESFINSARLEYEEADDNIKSKITNYASLVNAEYALEDVFSDIQINVVVALIDALPSLETIDTLSTEQIEQARLTYQALTDMQKLNIYNYNALIYAELRLSEYELAKNNALEVMCLINALPDNIGLEDEDIINNTFNEYFMLCEEAKGLVTNYNVLIAAKDELNLLLIQLQNAELVIDKIQLLPSDIQYGDKAVILSAYEDYQRLNGTERQFVYNAGAYSVLMQKYNRIGELEEAKSLGLAINDRILLLPFYPTITDEEAVTVVVNDYNNLCEDAKSFVDDINLLNLIQARLIAVINANAAALVDILICALPDIVTFEDEMAISEAREAYNLLIEKQKIYVTLYVKLIDCETQLFELYIAAKKDALEFDIDCAYLIDITIKSEDVIIVDGLRNSYNNLYEKAKEYVNNIGYLIAAEERLIIINAAVIAADNFDMLVNDLPDIITLEDQATVVTLRDTYDSLSNDEQSYVTQLDKLVAAENKIQLLLNNSSAQAIIDAIDNIPVIITIADKPYIEAIRTDYEALEDKDAVSNYAMLAEAEAVIAVMISNIIIAEDINDKISEIGDITFEKRDLILSIYYEYLNQNEEIKALINNSQLITALEAIDIVTSDLVDAYMVMTEISRLGSITLEKELKIIELLSEYETLAEAAKPYVINIDALLSAEMQIATLKDAQNVAEQIIILIESIGFVTLDSEDLINTINDEYQSASAVTQSMVTNYKVLEQANTDLYYLICQVNADIFDNLALALPDIITMENVADIEAARDYYDGMSDLSKALTNEFITLIAAEKAISILSRQNDSAQWVSGLIVALSDELCISDMQNVRAARYAYDELSATSRSMVQISLLNKLIDAEEAMATIYSNYLHALTVYNAIAALGSVILDMAEEIAIIRSAYDALTTAERVYITNKEILEEAELRIIELELAFSQAEEAITLIDSLPDIITLDMQNDIYSARIVYNSLNDDAKAFVINYNQLIARETELINLQRLNLIDMVISLIADIPDLENFSQDSIIAISAARQAYDNLFAEYMAAITNYSDLVYAESVLNEYLSEERAKLIINMILNISDTITIDDKDYLISVRTAYDELFNEDKLKVSNISILINAETRLTEILNNHAVAELWNADVRALLPVLSINITQQAEVDALRQRFEQMNEEAKSFAFALSDLEAIETHLISENLRISNAVDAVKVAINDIPDISNLLLRDADKITYARTEFDKLENIARDLVDNYQVLLLAELQIYRLQKYNTFNNSVSRIDYRDNEWSTILNYVEDFIEALFAADNYFDMDLAYLTIMDAIIELPTALDFSKQEAIEDIINYANSIGYSNEIDFSAIYAATNVYQITLIYDSINDTIASERQEQINLAIESTIYNIGNHIVDIVEEYLYRMEIESNIEFDITEPTATYADFRQYLKQVYNEEAVELIILFHKKAVVQLMFAENEAAMHLIGEECIDSIEEIPTLDKDKESYDTKRAKQLAIRELSNLINDNNRVKYTPNNWYSVQIKVLDAINAIDAAESLSEVNLLQEHAENAIMSVEIGNFDWIMWFIFVLLAVSSLTFGTLIVIVLIQNKRLASFE